MRRVRALRGAGALLAFFALALLYASVAASQAPALPELRATQPLMENWRFTQNDSLADSAALASTGADWQLVSLPHTWNAQDAASLDAGDYKRGIGWYRLEFETPASGARDWLEFGAVSLVGDVWLNGRHLGQHKGCCTAFRYDVTDLLARGAPNVLFVKANNKAPAKPDDLTAIAPLGGDFNVSGGLYRYVSLISTRDPVHFDLGDMGGPGVYATTTSISGGTAIINVRAKVKSDSAETASYTVRVSLQDAAGTVAATAEKSISLPAGGKVEVTQDITLGSAHLWQGTADPYLYRLVAQLVGSDGTPIDDVVQSFGVREMRFDANQGFFLNGQHVRLNGVAMHQDFLGKAWATSAADMDTSFALIKEIGAKAVRLGHYPFGPYALQRVSELGLVAWAEAPLGLRTTVSGCDGDPTEEYIANAKQQLQEMIRQQFNYAAIAMWAVGNETEARQSTCRPPRDNVTPVIRALHEVAKVEDPSRPTTYAEFTEDIGGSDPFPMGGITDLLATNRYYLWYNLKRDNFTELLDVLHFRYPSQPLGVSEYGAGAALTHHTDNPRGGNPEVRSAPPGMVSFQPEEYGAYVHEFQYGVISSKPYLWGSFAWNMFDFGSAHRNEGDMLGVNTKGLVSFDRKTRKDVFYFYKANWSTEPVTYITSRRYVDRAYPVADVKIYSNADSVELTVNGASAGSMSSAACLQRTCLFRNVALQLGQNTHSAVGNHGGTPLGDSVEWTLSSNDIHIAAGRLATGYVSSRKTRFGSDNFFWGGTKDTIGPEEKGGDPTGVRGTDDPQLYKYYRRGDFSYDVPLANGRYQLTLGFLEPGASTKDGERVFNVIANGQPLLENFDIRKTAGGSKTVITRTFSVAVSGQRLVIAFNPLKGEAVVSTIQIERR